MATTSISGDQKKRKPPIPTIVFQVSADQKARLQEMAGSRTVSAYLRDKILGIKTGGRRRPVKDWKALGHVLAALGYSELGRNLKIISDAARSNSLPFTPELLARLEDSCKDVEVMRRALTRALSLSGEGA